MQLLYFTTHFLYFSCIALITDILQLSCRVVLIINCVNVATCCRGLFVC